MDDPIDRLARQAAEETKTCATCAHWWPEHRAKEQRHHGPPVELWRPGREGDRVGICDFTMTEDGQPEDPAWGSEALAYGYAWGEGWRQCVLWTSEHFGCNQWAPKR